MNTNDDDDDDDDDGDEFGMETHVKMNQSVL